MHGTLCSVGEEARVVKTAADSVCGYVHEFNKARNISWKFPGESVFGVFPVFNLSNTIFVHLVLQIHIFEWFFGLCCCQPGRVAGFVGTIAKKFKQSQETIRRLFCD